MEYRYDVEKRGLSINEVNILSVSREKNYRHSYMSGRPYHAFIYTESGRMLDEFVHPQKTSIIAESGTLIFIPKGTKYYGTYLDDDTRLKLVQFDVVSGNLPEHLSVPRIIELKNAKSIINSFVYSFDNSKMNHFYHYLSLLYDLLWQIDSQYVELPKKFARLSPALNDISLHPERNEKISYYANMCYMSEGYFRRLFLEHTGLSPIDYRNDIRLKSARVMLQSGEYNVSEAALASGFSNLSFFTRLYKKKFGNTPKKD